MPRAPQATERPKADYAVQSVENALDLLDAICEEGGEARISQLSQRLGMSKTSVFRLLATFEGRGFVERSDDSLKYRLGLSACEMWQKILARMGVLRKARPAMSRLVRQCNESVYFVVRRNDYVLMLDMVDTTHQVKITPLVGQRFPLTTAPGRVFLAFEGEGGRKRVDVPGAVALAPAEREMIRTRGVCVDQEGFGDGVTCLVMPLFNTKAEVVAALAILGPVFRMGAPRIETELLPQLREAGAAISAGLGYLGDYSRQIAFHKTSGIS
jgi:IclR family transcriptional regulator, KDG regulon repressor